MNKKTVEIPLASIVSLLALAERIASANSVAAADWGAAWDYVAGYVDAVKLHGLIDVAEKHYEEIGAIPRKGKKSE